jgi:hypothetical protein
MSERIALPQDKGELVLARKILGMKNPSIEMTGSQLVPRTNKCRDGNVSGSSGDITLVARKSTRAWTPGNIARANKLKACKGLSGCEFVGCVKEAFGKIPPNLRKACPTIIDNIVLDNKNNILDNKLDIK